MTCDVKDNTLLITFTSDEMKIVTWVNSTFSQNEINNLIVRFLTQRKAQMDDVKKNQLWDQLKDHPNLDQILNTENPNGSLIINA